MRFTHSSTRRILLRSLYPWQAQSLPHTIALCRFKSTAHVLNKNHEQEWLSELLRIETEKDGSSRVIKTQSQELLKPLLRPPRHDAKMPKKKSVAGKTKSKTGSEVFGAKKSIPQPKVKIPKQVMSKTHYDQLVESKNFVYNFCARSLAVPKFTRSSTRNATTTTIDFPAQNISVQGVNRFWMAELDACLKFQEAVEKKLKDGPTPPENEFFLNASNAKQFLQFYGQQNRFSQFEEITKESIGVGAQIMLDDKPVGELVVAHTKRDAVALASLTAAVQLARDLPLLLDDFEHADRGSDGQILQSIRPIDLHIVSGMFNDIQKSSSLFLKSEHSATRRGTQIKRSWANTLHPTPKSSQDANRRNADLLRRHEAFMADPKLKQMRTLKETLPMNQRREEVLSLVNSNIYSIIVGSTGSGKTTQVPQIIFEDAVTRKCGADVDIICTQPRRIAAKSVAKRVADERNEALRDTVGYQVKGENETSRESGRMTYCTTGILLKQLQTNPDHIMDSASHIIIDEVHERDILIDFLMVSLKRIVEERQLSNERVPHIVLMSATMDTELFSNYFKQPDDSGKLHPCKSINVPGRTYPVSEKYLETILDELKSTYSKEDLQILQDRNTQQYLIEEFESEPRSTSPKVPQITQSNNVLTNMKDAFVPIGLVAATISHVARTTSEGAILAFLPGLQDIVATEKLLLQNLLGVDFTDESKYRIFKLHSNLKDKQDDIFDPVPDGCRKIILSTNIAETSVTIPDVQHVVDSGKLREKRYNQLVQITKLQYVWVSKSNMRQRAGRAGRVQNGNYYALYTSSRHSTLDATGLPEILRSDLMEVCLDVKAHSNYNIGEFLADSIQPPDPNSVNASVQGLKEIEALTENEDLTPLGRLLATLPVHPSLGKMIVLGVIFRCLDPLLILGAAANERPLFTRPLGFEKVADKDRESFGEGTFSDVLTTINAFREARHSLQQSRQTFDPIPPFFRDHYLHYNAFKSISNTMREIESLLREVGVIPNVSRSGDERWRECGDAALNRNSDNASLIRALVLAGHRGNLAVNGGATRHIFQTQTESRALVHQGSINSANSLSRNAADQNLTLPSPTLISFGSRHLSDQNDITLRNTTLVSPLIATLFGGPLELTGRNIVTVGNRFNFYVKSPGSLFENEVLKKFRTGLDILLSHACEDLAEQTTLADSKQRDRFASAIAHIIDQDFRMYLHSSANQEPSERRNRDFNKSRSFRTNDFSKSHRSRVDDLNKSHRSRIDDYL